MAFNGRQYTIQDQINRYSHAIQHARAHDPNCTGAGIQRLSNELEKWENRLALQENLNRKEEWD